MSNTSNKIVTYSLLAHINDHNRGIKDLCDLFVPLVKRALSKMASEGITKGKHISEIKTRFDFMYSLDIPFPLLSKIIKTIADEIIKTKGSEFIVYNDNAFAINNYTFAEFDEEIIQEELNASKLETAYKAYLEVNEVKPSKANSLFDFIDNNRVQLMALISDKKKDFEDKDFTLQAKFINTLKADKNLYKILCKIYLGSIITCYLEFEPDRPKKPSEKEFLLDTNFIISLLGLNAIESVHTCQKIVEICQRFGYKVCVLDLTIQETKNLLERTANNLETSFLQKKINPESIFNACDVKDLSKTDLEKISSELEHSLKTKYYISIIYNSSKYQNLAKYSRELKIYKKARSSTLSAMHDTTAIMYVQQKRGRKFRNYFSANSFFVTNTNRDSKPPFLSNEKVSEIIRAEDLVNILWLTNPNVKINLNNEELVEIGLSKLVASTLNKNLPTSRIIRELEDNIQKYAQHNISDKDILRVATRIADKTLRNLDKLNKIAKSAPDKFVKRLKIEADKEKEREKKLLENVFEMLNKVQNSTDEKVKQTEIVLRKKYEELIAQTESESKKRITEIEFSKKSELRLTKEDTYEKLTLAKSKLDKKASNQTHLKVITILLIPIIVGLCLVLNFEWNDLEPFIYIVTLGYYIATYLFFYFTNKEWSPVELYSSSLERKKLKIYKKYSFDYEYYNSLSKDVENIDEQLQTN